MLALSKQIFGANMTTALIIRLSIPKFTEEIKQMLGANFEMLSVRQHKPLEEQKFNDFRIFNGNY